MILRRYMTQQVAVTTALVLGFLVVLLLGGRVIRYFGLAAEGQLDISLLFSIIGYNLPYFLELILPLSFFTALMLVFGRLYVDHEMAVLNASGVSRGKLARFITPLILALFVAEAGLTLVGKPWGVRQADGIWAQQALTSAFDLIRPQNFISGDGYHLYVGSMSADKTELQDVIVIQDGDEDAIGADIKDTVILAKKAVQVLSEDSTDLSNLVQLDLFQGRRYDIGAGSLAYNQVSFERYRVSITRPMADNNQSLQMGAQPIGRVWQLATLKSLPLAQKIVNNTDTPINTTELANENNQQILPAQAELGYRLALPWLMIIAPMLAVPLAQVRPRQGRWLRLLPAIIIFTSCALFLVSLKDPISKGRLSAWIYALTIFVFMAFALYLNWASRLHQRFRVSQQNKQFKGRSDSLAANNTNNTNSTNNNTNNTNNRDGGDE